MPLSCVAYGCSNHNMMENKPGFYRFPNNDPELRKKWVNACKRKNKDGTPWNPIGKNVYICGKHFITGKPERKDPNHPDHVPSLFVFDKIDSKKHQKKVERYNSVKKRRKITIETGASLDTNETLAIQQIEKPSLPQSQTPEIFTPPTTPVDFTLFVETPIAPVPHVESTPEIIDDEETSLLVKYNKEIQNLRQERDDAIKQIDQLKDKFLCYKSLCKLPKKFKYYTGIQLETFDVLFKYLKTTGSLTTKPRSLPYQDQLLMTLIKLRLDLPFESLADQFLTPKTSVHDIFKRWVNLMFVKLGPLIKYPDHDASFKTLPHVFRQYFPKLTSIIDCSEIFIDRPKSLKARAQTYSNYKKHSTVKFLIACTPHGAIAFISRVWGGRVSDVEIVQQSGFISQRYHHPGDQILADRGFTLVDEFAAGCGAELIIPSFTKGKKQLSAKEVETSRHIASIRIHIERVIGLLKNRYRILDGTLPITLVKSLSDERNNSDIANVDKLLTVCAALVNLGDGIVYKDS